MERFKDKYIFYADGLKFHEITQGILNIEEYMILSMEYPGKLEEIVNSVFPDVFLVDYVRVYQKNKLAKRDGLFLFEFRIIYNFFFE